MLIGACVIRSVCVHDRHGIGQYRLRAVMIGDDHINAKLVRARHLLHGGNAVVDRDNERHTLLF